MIQTRGFTEYSILEEKLEAAIGRTMKLQSALVAANRTILKQEQKIKRLEEKLKGQG